MSQIYQHFWCDFEYLVWLESSFQPLFIGTTCIVLERIHITHIKRIYRVTCVVLKIQCVKRFFSL